MDPFLANYDPGPLMTGLFVTIVVGVVAADTWLVGQAVDPLHRKKWLARTLAVAALWLGAHAAVASSGILESLSLPPPAMPYLFVTMGCGVAVALSPVGRRLASLPLAWLVGLQAFRVPLEIWLHALADAGHLPVSMTWSGYNFDVLTGLSAIVLAALHVRKPLPRGVLVAWNVIGLGLLVTVVSIAVRSIPGPLRYFTEDPPVVLPFHAPFNWIASVLVWTALVGHLVVFRALRRPHEPA